MAIECADASGMPICRVNCTVVEQNLEGARRFARSEKAESLLARFDDHISGLPSMIREVESETDR
jgi:hypothetical protein